MLSNDLFGKRIKVERPREPSIDYLIAEAHGIIDRAMQEHSAAAIVPLLSGGHDSATACHVTSEHPSAAEPMTVHHIDTGTGAKKTREYIERLCRLFGWKLRVWRSENPEDTMEAIVRAKGMPGPGMHPYVYMRLKHRSVTAMAKEYAIGLTRPAALISGVRLGESSRRMGHAVEIQRGRLSKGRIYDGNQMFVSPCLHWTRRDQVFYMQEMDIPASPVKVATGKSGECNCQCYAKPGEEELLAIHTPDVVEELNRLRAIAKECGHGDQRGDESGDDDFMGLLCFGCEIRAK